MEAKKNHQSQPENHMNDNQLIVNNLIHRNNNRVDFVTISDGLNCYTLNLANQINKLLP